MAQVTIYLDEDTEARMRAAAQAEGVAVSRWIAGLIRAHTRDAWPQQVRELAGAWRDFPDPREQPNGTDVPRERL